MVATQSSPTCLGRLGLHSLLCVGSAGFVRAGARRGDGRQSCGESGKGDKWEGGG